MDYDGSEYPEVHMARFETLVMLHQYSEGIKCRIFSTTLTGLAQQWFRTLDPGSIHSFEDLHDMFMCQFSSSRQTTKTAMSLMEMWQESNETLKEYVTRFNMASLAVPKAESQIKVYAFTRGLKPGPLFDDLQINPPHTFDDIMRRLPGAPEPLKRAQKQPRMVHSVNQFTDYTPLNTPQEEIFQMIKDEPWFHAPTSYVQGPPRQGPNKLLCHYHNAYGHPTQYYVNLKRHIEVLVRQGKLDRSVKQMPPPHHQDTDQGRQDRGGHQQG
ncbi:uncharacterized protein LOC130994203 [Salvia miltiorrhiza]|uniref:uncharacterized protein LOC130994203 n=1 Tax=Salvia miltiorrhiza TaxID=226208 RepID=UPI0025AC5574|nr:uncharacterized protein LOC130994203 [Salvia miltiorrhiza]